MFKNIFKKMDIGVKDVLSWIVFSFLGILCSFVFLFLVVRLPNDTFFCWFCTCAFMFSSAFGFSVIFMLPHFILEYKKELKKVS